MHDVRRRRRRGHSQRLRAAPRPSRKGAPARGPQFASGL